MQYYTVYHLSLDKIVLYFLNLSDSVCTASFLSPYFVPYLHLNLLQKSLHDPINIAARICIRIGTLRFRGLPFIEVEIRRNSNRRPPSLSRTGGLMVIA